MGMILGYGLCSLFGLFYSAAHTVIPFLLLGIGIDNIFVITQTFNTLGEFSFLFWFFLSWRLFSRNYLNPCTAHREIWPNYETCRFVLCHKIGKTLEKILSSGVAVSVTTFTDVIAFFVGSNTVLPGLQSFCIYAAVAIFAIYALQVTHFVAWFSLGLHSF